eukprot:gnl/TRDRNA2_/TRDRNA2_94796_c0_seq1.p1 gnl/TRDRNA2_/TRDRNA2_94796_c0~~gnl/TRDRNA2_/TRDRNA2_94796_c0_seq1.p1  ORF type:complete len:229 (+),score=31.08 gnl/TRDRNA2_/TRDRNA2_94796_c0_seq1:45-731(+)
MAKASASATPVLSRCPPHILSQQRIPREERLLAGLLQRKSGDDLMPAYAVVGKPGQTPFPAASTTKRSASTPALASMLSGCHGEISLPGGAGASTSGRSNGKRDSGLPPIDESAGNSRTARKLHGLSRTTTATSLVPPSTADTTRESLLFFDDNERRKVPRLSSASSLRSSHFTSISTFSLRKEVEQAVQEEVSRAIKPLQDKLESERAARERAEKLLSEVRVKAKAS